MEERPPSVKSYHSEDWYGVEKPVVLERKASKAASLTQAIMLGPHPHKKESGVSLHQESTFGRGELEDMYLEDLLASGEKERRKTQENIRATMGFWKLIWSDLKFWYRRYKLKHQESRLFKKSIKVMESNFGSAIGSLFVFTRWVLVLNVVLSVLWLSFVVLPTAVHFSYDKINKTFAFKNLLDGKGAVSQSWLFFGSYPEKVPGGYHIGLAYLTMLVITYFGSLYVILGRILIGGGCTAIVYLVLYANFAHVLPNKGSGDSMDFISTYATTVIFSLINFTVPSCIRQLPKMEQYASGRDELNITLSRIFFLRMANLFALITSIYNTVTKYTVGCVGTVIGQELFKLVILDTFLHSVMQLTIKYAKYFWKREKNEFDISSAVLVLIYRQALIWTGTLACPIMPVLGVISDLVFFYINYTVISNTCKPPIKRWNQSRNTSFFSLFLLGTLGILIPPFSIIIGSAELVNVGQTEVPGEFCGPFGSDKPTRSVTKFGLEQPQWLEDIIRWVLAEPFLLPVFFILLSYAIHQRSQIGTDKQQRTMLQAELQQEREANEKLIKKLQSMGIGVDRK